MRWVMRPLHTGLPEQFLCSDGAPEAEEVLVNVAKLYRDWSGSAYYVSPESDDFKRHKYDGAAKRIQAGEELYMPILHFQYDEPTGNSDVDRVKFFDGRHSYAAARTAGHEELPVCIPRRQIDRFRRQFGVVGMEQHDRDG